MSGHLISDRTACKEEGDNIRFLVDGDKMNVPIFGIVCGILQEQMGYQVFLKVAVHLHTFRTPSNLRCFLQKLPKLREIPF